MALATTSFLILAAVVHADPKRDALWAAVRNGDVKSIEKALADGGDVNARNEYGVTALWIASSKGKFDVIKLLVDKGADVNSRDDIWYQTPLTSASGGGDAKTVELLIKAGAKNIDAALLSSGGNLQVVEAILRHAKPSQEALDAALHIASSRDPLKAVLKTGSTEDLKKALTAAGAKPLPKISDEERKELRKIVGAYESDGGFTARFSVGDYGLMMGNRVLKRVEKDRFAPYGSPDGEFRIHWKNGEVSEIIMKRVTAEYSLHRFKEPTLKSEAAPNVAADVEKPMNWPSFRGPDGTGVADSQHPPVKWDAKKNEGVRWKTRIPGLGHSCPVVWGDRIFITTAVSKGDPDPRIRIGNYGDVGSVDDASEHVFKVICVHRDTGEILWSKDAYTGVPKIKRHLKGSQANCTAAVDGKHVIACFGSEGLYCYDFHGKQLWKRDLSALDSSFTLDRDYEWGFGNSPVIFGDYCILQCDLSRDSFIAAFRLSDGDKVWSTPRDEIPSWSSPVVWQNGVRTEIVTNAAQYARGYDPLTGAELWRIAKKSEVTVPTPVLGKDLAYISSGNRPIQPIIAIRPGAKGDISLKDGETKSEFVAWSRLRGGPYMPTPILYGDYFYTCSNSGVICCYDAKTGKEVYKERAGGSSYTASPLAADGRIYITAEEGDVRVFKAGPMFELIAVNPLDDYCMAVPAISNGAFIARTQKYLMSLGKK